MIIYKTGGQICFKFYTFGDKTLNLKKSPFFLNQSLFKANRNDIKYQRKKSSI